MSENLGSLFVIIVVCFIAVFLIVLLMPITRFKCIDWVYTKLKKYFLWNFMLRLLLEAGLELAFCCVLNLRYGNVFTYTEPVGFGSAFNFFCAVFFTVVLCCMPLAILVAYCCNFDKLGDEDF